MTSSVAEKLLALPNLPGVYFFKDISGKIIYVGKAKNLKNRVGSYFHLPADKQETKTGALVSRINDIDYLIVETEFDALVLEAEFIKKYKPKYNIIQKDDKSYLYIVIRNDKVKSLEGNFIKIEKIITARRTEINPKDIVFGPYPNSLTPKLVIRTLRKVFPHRDCSVNKFATYQRKAKPCLYGQLKLCNAPCVRQDVSIIEAHKKNIQNIKRVLKGGSFSLLKMLRNKMQKFSNAKQFEEAAVYRDLIARFNYVRQKIKSPEVYMENPTFVDDMAAGSIKSLSDLLPILPAPPKRIECYDISNISGNESVGSMVVAIDGKINKSFYRKFRIKTKHTPDDFYMLQEVLRRRLKRTNGSWYHPDLLVIDGGKGQVSSIAEIIKELNLAIPLIGLAKKEETIVYISNGNFKELLIDKNNPGLNLLIKLRDEAHRFAQAYHHELRLKQLFVK